ncbi:MAG: sensor histidine kinase [Polyangiales bacterium]
MSVIVFTLFAGALGVALWNVWKQRSAADERAASAAEGAALAEAVNAIAHDVDNLMSVLLMNLSAAHHAPPNELEETLGDAERAARSAGMLVRAMRGQTLPPVTDEPLEPIVKLMVALQRRRGADMDLTIEGSMTFTGHAADAFRIVHNLLENAVREAKQIEGGRTTVVVAPQMLSVSNPVRAPESLAASIYERGVSGQGSSGLGLAITREAAARLGMRLEHRMTGNVVTFQLDGRAPASGVVSKNDLLDPARQAS